MTPAHASPLATPDFLRLFGDAAILSWVLRLRWIALGALLGLGCVLTLLGALTWPMLVVAALLGAVTAAYNLVFLVLLHLSPLWENPRALTFLRGAQIPADVLVLTIGIHATGGATTPLAGFYVFIVITALAVSPRHGAYLTAALSTFCYCALVILELAILPPPVNPALAQVPASITEAPMIYGWHLLTVLGILWLVAYGAGRLAQRIGAGEELIQHQLTDLGVLYRFSDNLSSSLNLDQAMQYIVTELGGLLGASSCSLMLINEQGLAEFRAATGLSAEALAAYRRHPLSAQNPLLAAILNGRNGVFAPEVDEVAGLRDVLLRPETRSFYCFPLRAKGRAVGLLNLSFTLPYNMSPSTYDLIATCARQAALAIERGVLYEETDRAAREMTSLYRIGLATSSSLEIDRVMREIADQVQRLMNPDSLVLALCDDACEGLESMLIREGAVDVPRRMPMPLDRAGGAGWMVRNQKPLLIRHWDQEVANLPFVPFTAGEQPQSYVGSPLIAANRVIGVISAQKLTPNSYHETDLRLLSAIAAQAALALENARLHEAARQQAQRDSLTGALNHAALIASIDNAIARARAQSGTVALVMLDIDLFKQYNDTHGHVAGDDALRAVVQAILQSVKHTDSVGRWGGEEFGVLLPGAGRAQALAVAQRIRMSLAFLTMPATGGANLPMPTVSQGIACYPEDAPVSALLVDHADSALYQAKALGRDAIVLWGEDPDPIILDWVGTTDP